MFNEYNNNELTTFSATYLEKSVELNNGKK